MIEPLSRTRAALVVVDVQDRLSHAMPPPIRDQVVHNTVVLIETARRLALPIVVTQQYPKGLGTTVAAIAEALPPDAHRFDKVEFSAADCAEFAGLARHLGSPDVGRDQWIVAGMEAHICVYQSARGLVARGFQVHVAADAIASRTKLNWQVALRLIERVGAIVSSTETCMFDLLGRAATDDFKALSRLIR
jgi:nicotinamidase-related amidase